METHDRPDPDALLASIHRESSKQRRGRLRIFFGMAPGVGKTYAMLAAGKQRLAEGIDVVVGVVETHGRSETGAMLAGLPILARRQVDYRGIHLEEFDLDAALARRPALILIDELAHSNVVGSRHPKRYQDVLELLDAGIDVYSTVNVQHLASRADIVSQITGIAVRETVPDSLIEMADVDLVDLPPEQLRARLAEGKVYLGDRAAVASDHFFRPGNLTALREMALRVTAERVDQELRDFMRSQQISGPWKAAERLLVAVSPSPFSARLVRWTRRTAAALDASWIVVHVESSRAVSEAEKARVTQNLELARELGAEVITTTGDDVVESLLRVARQNNVTQIVLGKSPGHPWSDFLRGGSLVDRVVRNCGDIDVYVVRAESGTESGRQRLVSPATRPPLAEYLHATLAVVGIVTGCLLLRTTVGYSAVSLVLLATVLVCGLYFGRGPVLLAAALSAVAWNFLFIPPLYTFHIAEVHDTLTFGLFFVVALVVGSLTERLKRSERAERHREERATALYRFIETLATSATLEDAFVAAARHINAVFHADSTVLFEPTGATDEGLVPYPLSLAAMSDRDRAVAAWAYSNGRAAGRFTDTLGEADAIFLPIKRLKVTFGVLRVAIPKNAALSFSERQLLETFADQLAAVIERDRLAQAVQMTRLSEEADRLRSTLLDCVSHELKTPLAAVAAASEGLAAAPPPSTAQALVDEIREGVRRLHRVINGLLDMTRLETGIVRPQREWCEIRELVESAIEDETVALRGRDVTVEIPPNLPLVKVDFSLLSQALGKLLGNSGVHSPVGQPVRVSADVRGGELTLAVTDRGAGLPDGVPIFEKFTRGDPAHTGGIGLGLSIARGFVEAHGGSLRAEAASGGGVAFVISLPVETSHLAEVTP